MCRYMNDIRAILFDVDGTLLDTREYIFQAFEHALSAHGYTAFTREDITRVIGMPLKDCYRALIGEDNALIERLAALHHAFQLEHSDLSAPFAHVPETLSLLNENGFKLGAVTNRRSQTTLKTLSEAGLTPFFGAIVCLDQVEKPKPDPMHLLKALTMLNEAPNHTAMVGDSSVDIEAGKNTGTKTVFARYGFHYTLPKGLVPDATIDDIRDILTLIG